MYITLNRIISTQAESQGIKVAQFQRYTKLASIRILTHTADLHYHTKMFCISKYICLFIMRTINCDFHLYIRENPFIVTSVKSSFIVKIHDGKLAQSLNYFACMDYVLSTAFWIVKCYNDTCTISKGYLHAPFLWNSGLST